MRKVIFTALVAVISIFGTQAQKVSLDSCRSMAVRSNKTLQVAREGIEGASYLRKAAKAAYLPGIDFNMTYAYNQHKINLLGADAKLPTMTFNPLTQSYDYNILINPLDGKPVTDPSTGTPIPLEVAVIPKEALSYDIHNVAVGTILLTQPVFMGGRIKALNEIAKYGEELARATRNAAAQDIIYAVDESYWTVVSLTQKKLLAESFVNLVDTLRHNVDLMVKEGVATRADALNVGVKYNEAQIALTKVDNGLSLSRMALAQLCGLPVETRMELEDEVLSTSAAEPRSMEYSLGDVYARRQDLEALRQGINIFEQKEKIARADMLPTLGVAAAYTFSNPNVINGFEKRFGGGFSVGATLTIPIWHWGGNYNKYRAAKSETNAQRLVLEDAEDKIQLQIRQAEYSYQEAFKTFDMTTKNLESANENLRCAQLGFREGVLTADDVIAAQTAWLKAHSEKIDAEIGIQLCKVYLSKVLGYMDYKPLPENPDSDKIFKNFK